MSCYLSRGINVLSTVTLVSLLIVLFLLILCSAFFSSSETSMMTVNRYRLKHLARNKHKAAERVSGLLARMDRLLGVVLIGNTFANVLASAVATVIAFHIAGDIGVAVGTIILTLLILIFGEIAPKTVAALYSQPVAFALSVPLLWLSKVLYPIVGLANWFVNGLLRLCGIKVKNHSMDHLDREELRSVVMESAGLIPQQHQDMLLRILDLEQVTVDDVMIPRNEITAINLEDDWEDIVTLLTESIHTRLPLYRDDINDALGMVSLRRVLHDLATGALNKARLENMAEAVYFVPEGTSLNQQLINFRKQEERCGLVVDEYGDIQGLITVEDILEEIVGELTTDIPSIAKLVQAQADGSYWVDGSANLRELNRLLHWHLPTDGPKTLSGLIIEYLETLPDSGIGLVLNGYPVEVLETSANRVKMAKVMPQLRRE